MKVSRREVVRRLTVGAAGGLLGTGLIWRDARRAVAQTGRSLQINLLGYSLEVHIPSIAAIFDLLPVMPGYARPRTARLDQIRTLTQTLVAGAADIGETDPPTVFRAVEQGANLKIIGNFYVNTDLVFVANADKIRDFKDLEKPGVTVAVNGKGDITYILLVGPLLKHGVDLSKLTVVEIGGSGARMQALLAGRVDAVPMHLDQAGQVVNQGHFKILIEPWKEYRVWINEVWAVNGAWIAKPENQRAAVDLMKAVITAFRRADQNLPWYVGEYHKYATLPHVADMTAVQLQPLWRRLVDEVKAWPPNNGFRREDFHDLLPVYKAAGAIAGTVNVDQVVDPTYTAQALKELGG